jgi:hypothetical protein
LTKIVVIIADVVLVVVIRVEEIVVVSVGVMIFRFQWSLEVKIGDLELLMKQARC